MKNELVYTKEQEDFFSAVKNTSSHIGILATSGSSKSTIIVEAAKRIVGKKVLLLSFSNFIVDELKKRLDGYDVEVSTTHAKGYSLLRSKNSKIIVNPNKVFEYVLGEYKKKTDTKTNLYAETYKTVEVINFIRMTLTELDNKSVTDMCDFYSIDCSANNITDAITFFPYVTNTNVIDLCDMVYQAAVNIEPNRGVYDFIFLDEAQDINESQKKLILSLLGESGRLISVGDLYQSIYGFAGSTTQCFKDLMSIDNTISLPLSTSFRCGKAIVKQAMTICPTIRAFESNDEGQVDEKAKITDIKNGDMVLCRVTAPLVEMFFQLLELGVSSTIEGKEIETTIKALIKDTKCKTKEQFKIHLLNEEVKLRNGLLKDGYSHPERHPKMIKLQEGTSALFSIMKYSSSIAEMSIKIKTIFKAKKDSARLMTIHRAKGSESNNVYIIEKFNGKTLIPHSKASSPRELEEEQCILFVAITRAIKKLGYISLNVKK